ncbi:MAG: YbjQ family protein [Deltaproteobacteria bacterium]|nr:YbjQ family protein [Deltaproteobacteria bacterium]
MSELIVILIYLSSFIFFFYAIGKIIEIRHLKNLESREKALSGMVLTNTKKLPGDLIGEKAWLCQGSVVIGADHFKRLAAGLRNIVGGRMKSIESVLDRARREAVLRMAEQAKLDGASALINIRLETSTIGTAGNGNGLMIAEVLAYGTAFRARAKF